MYAIFSLKYICHENQRTIHVKINIIYMDPTAFVYNIWFGWLLFASFCGETLHFPMQPWLAESPARETRPSESGRTLAFNQRKGRRFWILSGQIIYCDLTPPIFRYYNLARFYSFLLARNEGAPFLGRTVTKCHTVDGSEIR